jgi:hypothetical protein
MLDLTIDAARKDGGERYTFGTWPEQNIPLYLVDGLNHSTILREPSAELQDLVVKALGVKDMDGYKKVSEAAHAMSQQALTTINNPEWQQFIVRCVDERGDPIPDYYIQLVTEKGQIGERDFEETELDNLCLDTHAYSSDNSLRCFHVDLSTLKPEIFEGKRLYIKIIASSGSTLVGYWGYGFDATPTPCRGGPRGWDAKLEITPLLTNAQIKFFHPFTTTLIEIRMNREPIPFNREEPSPFVKLL